MPLNQPPLRDSREGCQPPPWQQPLKLPIQALCTAGCTAVAGQSSWPSPPSWRDKQQAGAATLSCCSLQHIAPFLAEPASAESPGSLPWSPLKGGWLSGKMSREVGEAPEGSRVQQQSAPGAAKNVQSGPNWSELADKETTWRVLDEVAAVAKEKGKTVAQIALRWLLDKNNVPSVVIGVKKIDQLEDNLATMGWILTKDEIERLDAASNIPAPYPYEMINRLK